MEETIQAVTDHVKKAAELNAAALLANDQLQDAMLRYEKAMRVMNEHNGKLPALMKKAGL